MSRFKAAQIQMRTELDLQDTLSKMERAVLTAADSGADIAVLPEMWSCPYSPEYFKLAYKEGHGEVLERMQETAAKASLILVGGSIPEVDGGKLYNTCFVINEKGEVIARHRKIHLFDVDLPEVRFMESETFSPGVTPTVFDTRFGRFGTAICFDVRFPELFRLMANMGAEAVFLPAQFSMSTGRMHWETLVRARAIDNQIFMVACGAATYKGFSYECWGHSMTADPYGTVTASCGGEETTIYSDIDTAALDDARSRLPVHLHLRQDVYSVASGQSK